MDIHINTVYTFSQLEDWLNSNWSNCLVVKNQGAGHTAVMHTFDQDFDDDFKMGDGILFYNDGVACSAGAGDKFMVVSIINF